MQFLYRIPGYILLLFGGFCLSWGGLIIRSFEQATVWQILFLRSFFFLIALIIFLFTILKINKNEFSWLINEFKVKNINIGDLIYDSYVRKGRRYKNPKIDLYFLNILFKTIYRTINIDKIISNYPVKFIFVSTSTYADNDAIALRIGLEKKIKVIIVIIITVDK